MSVVNRSEEELGNDGVEDADAGAETTAAADDLDTFPAEVKTLVERTLAVLRKGQADLLDHYWQVGACFARFLNLAARGGAGTVTVRDFAAALTRAGQDCSPSTLHLAKKIHDTYDRAALPGMVARGLSVTHLKSLLPLDETVRAKVEERMQATPLSSRDLRAVIREERGEAAATRFQAAPTWYDGEATDSGDLDEDAAADAARAIRAGGAMRIATDPRVAPPEDEIYSEDSPGPRNIGPGPGPVPARARTVVHEYSRPPLPAIKSATNAAEKFADQLPALWRTLDEVSRVGWDSDKARDNFRQEVERMLTIMEGLQAGAPEAVRRLRSSLSDLA
jgi:hypothetical protein